LRERVGKKPRGAKGACFATNPLGTKAKKRERAGGTHKNLTKEPDQNAKRKCKEQWKRERVAGS